MSDLNDVKKEIGTLPDGFFFYTPEEIKRIAKEEPIKAGHIFVEFFENVNLNELFKLYHEQTVLTAKIQRILNSLAEVADRIGLNITEPAAKVNWEWDGELLKITLPFLIPKLNYYANGWKDVRDSLIMQLARGLKDLPEDIKFQRAFCIFKFWYEKRIDWDAHNRAYHSIINALRLRKVIVDDSVKYLVPVLIGEKAPSKIEQKTEVFLFEVDKFNKFSHLFLPETPPENYQMPADEKYQKPPQNLVPENDDFWY
ncbi:hypothetical protein [Carboxydothermus ferrireducens]|uniref:Uncharacterized protein n=1 Tax=Carboxydothermus ferrireducens DSM 11255 TaxID=1119529 RepID=A0ABX2R7L6_9THEO|nr:hypothetical protein [Carboxydothermus ferrireducens]NYE57166.1 hypothetical protein [Carboxydothermus ferrireducens DSM 11255]